MNPAPIFAGCIGSLTLNLFCNFRLDAAQFAIAKAVLGHQLHALGILATPEIEYECDAVNLLTEVSSFLLLLWLLDCHFSSGSARRSITTTATPSRSSTVVAPSLIESTRINGRRSGTVTRET